MEESKEEAKDGDEWYTSAVNWAKENELVYENDKDSDPLSEVSREQLASVLYLYSRFKGNDVSVGEDTNILSYDDAFDIAEYAIPAIQYMVGAGIMNGKTDSTLNPKDNTTRAEIAVMLERFISYNIRMEEIRKNTVDYTRDFTSFMYQPETENEVLELLKNVDRCSYGTAGSSLSGLVSGVSVLKLSETEGVLAFLSAYLDGMDATQHDYFSFQWQMGVKKAKAILENPDSFKGEMSDAGMEDVDLSGFDNDGLDALNTAVVNELEKRGVKDEWKNHLEETPFTHWELEQM
jgi:hypothetical protein